MAPEVVYLCHKINPKGLYPLAKKVEAVQGVPVWLLTYILWQTLAKIFYHTGPVI